jgi:hypothetical protein
VAFAHFACFSIIFTIHCLYLAVENVLILQSFQLQQFFGWSWKNWPASYMAILMTMLTKCGALANFLFKIRRFPSRIFEASNNATTIQIKQIQPPSCFKNVGWETPVIKIILHLCARVQKCRIYKLLLLTYFEEIYCWFRIQRRIRERFRIIIYLTILNIYPVLSKKQKAKCNHMGLHRSGTHR